MLASIVQVAGYKWANSTLSSKDNWLLNAIPGLDYESNAYIIKAVQLFIMQTRHAN